MFRLTTARQLVRSSRMLLPATQVQTRNFGLFDRIFKKKENEGAATKKE